MSGAGKRGGRKKGQLTEYSATTRTLKLACAGIGFDELRLWCLVRGVDFTWMLRLLRSRRYRHLRWSYSEVGGVIRITPGDLTAKELGVGSED